jgi:hypothetical protein
MNKTLLVILAAIALVVGVNPAAQADAFLSLSNGATTVSCQNDTAANVTACGTAGFTTTLHSNQIDFNGGTVGGYSVTDVLFQGNSPGTPSLAFTLDTKSAVTNVSGGSTTFIIRGAENNYTLPAGSPLTLSASQSGTFTNAASTAGVGQAFTGFGDNTNSLVPGTGTADTTPFCQNPATAPPVQSCSQTGAPLTFTRSGAFALSGIETIFVNQGGTASFTATTAVTPPAAQVPEPSSLVLMGTGMILLAGRKLRKK